MAERRGEQDKVKAQIAAIEQRVKNARKWWGTVAPRHIDPDQFVHLCLGMIRQGSDRLMQAVIQSPESFMVAVAECARLGLVPGDTYYFVPFRNNKQGVYEVTGIVAWQGEVDLIYRAGGVTSVHVQEVRANDTFIWRRGTMDLPHHVIHGPDGSAQEGLGDDEERGPLTGVYAYARMLGGGYSEPVIMSRGTVKKHYDAAKTHDFWGEWNDCPEKPWTVDMWRKTAVHKLYDLVPHSAEFQQDRLRMMAATERDRLAPPAIERPSAADDAFDGTRRVVLPGDGQEAADGGPGAGNGSSGDDDRKRALAKIHAIFREHHLGAKDQEDTRRAIITGLLTPEAAEFPLDYIQLSKLTPQVTIATAAALESWIEGKPGQDVTAGLVAYAGRVRESINRRRKAAAEAAEPQS
jgi:recombination protein RecT